MKIVVYTAITGGYDKLVEQDIEAPCVAFLDYEPQQTNWTVARACSLFKDSNRNAKIHKVLPHQYFDVDYSLWIDGNLKLTIEPQTLINKYLSDADMALFSHYGRSNIYQEAIACKRRGVGDAVKIDKQIEVYGNEVKGLYECPIILRRHTDEIEKFNNYWWSEISRHSKRDQLSFPYVKQRLGIKVRLFDDVLYGGNICYKKNNHEKSTKE